MRGVKTLFLISIAAILLAALALKARTTAVPSADDATYDIVIANGHVMDPESGLDEVRNVGITAGKIRALSATPLKAKTTLDAKGLVVAPGFIDLHEHGQAPRNYQFQAHDGVTTSLELEVGTDNVDAWYAARENKSLINYGVSVGHIPVRMQVMHDAGNFLPTGDAAHREATPRELAEINSGIHKGLQRGALGVGLGINYTAAATHDEIVELFRIAAAQNAPVHVHVRYAGMQEPATGLVGIEEVIAAAASTGAPLHIVHITSIGLKNTPQLLAVIKGAQKHGLDVTTECYPYIAASTRLESAIFDPGWQERQGITFKDLQWSGTGERLSAETFDKFRKQGGSVVIFSIPAEAARAAVADPMVMIASDGIPGVDPRMHPRGQGTFSRVLGHYVREEKALDLMAALRKMTLMPAQRLQNRASAFKDKGRIRIGADADITVFDPQRIIDKATFENPLQYSDGIQFVLVNGTPVLANGQLVEAVFPGRPARAPLSN
jgi:N-acyl-D-aspartate/D-glutamate deacylase